MKDFGTLRTELNEAVEPLDEHAMTSASMPPNILILRRKTVRQFPNHTMVALYYNDKLDQYFSIPYGGDVSAVVTPVSLKEAEELQEISYELGSKAFNARISRSRYASKKGLFDVSKKHLDKATQTARRLVKKNLKEEELVEFPIPHTPGRAEWMTKFEKHVVKHAPEHAGKIDWDSAHYMHRSGKGAEESAKQYVNIRKQLPESVESLHEGVIDRLKHIRDFHAVNHIEHDDRTRTRVDPTTANALLTVHAALKPEHQEKFAQHLQHSKAKFHKMLDFTWKQVK